MYANVSKEEARALNAKQMRKYRAEHPEKMQAYDRARYRNVKAEREKIERWGDQRCDLCEIAMASKFGADGTFKYCRSCSDNHQVKRYIRVMATRRWRAKHLGIPFVPIKFEDMVNGKNIRRSPGNAKRNDKRREAQSRKYECLI